MGGFDSFRAVFKHQTSLRRNALPLGGEQEKSPGVQVPSAPVSTPRDESASSRPKCHRNQRCSRQNSRPGRRIRTSDHPPDPKILCNPKFTESGKRRQNLKKQGHFPQRSPMERRYCTTRKNCVSHAFFGYFSRTSAGFCQFRPFLGKNQEMPVRCKSD